MKGSVKKDIQLHNEKNEHVRARCHNNYELQAPREAEFG